MQVVEQLSVEFGLIKTYPETDIYYDGEDDSGVTIIIDTLGPASGVRINRTSGSEFIQIDSTKLTSITGSDIQQYDHIEINTRKGKKSAILSRNGVKYNILHALTTSSKWIHMEKGMNKFTFSATSGVDNLRVYLDYNERYNGV